MIPKQKLRTFLVDNYNNPFIILRWNSNISRIFLIFSISILIFSNQTFSEFTELSWSDKIFGRPSRPTSTSSSSSSASSTSYFSMPISPSSSASTSSSSSTSHFESTPVTTRITWNKAFPSFRNNRMVDHQPQSARINQWSTLFPSVQPPTQRPAPFMGNPYRTIIPQSPAPTFIPSYLRTPIPTQQNQSPMISQHQHTGTQIHYQFPARNRFDSSRFFSSSNSPSTSTPSSITSSPFSSFNMHHNNHNNFQQQQQHQAQPQSYDWIRQLIQTRLTESKRHLEQVERSLARFNIPINKDNNNNNKHGNFTVTISANPTITTSTSTSTTRRPSYHLKHSNIHNNENNNRIDVDYVDGGAALAAAGEDQDSDPKLNTNSNAKDVIEDDINLDYYDHQAHPSKHETTTTTRNTPRPLSISTTSSLMQQDNPWIVANILKPGQRSEKIKGQKFAQTIHLAAIEELNNNNGNNNNNNNNGQLQQTWQPLWTLKTTPSVPSSLANNNITISNNHTSSSISSTTTTPAPINNASGGDVPSEISSSELEDNLNMLGEIEDDDERPPRGGESGFKDDFNNNNNGTRSIIKPKWTFRCPVNVNGFFADLNSDCQAYYHCSGHRRERFRFQCPEGTKFNERSSNCDWEDNVDCHQQFDLLRA